MGMFDTMNQSAQTGVANQPVQGNGGSFAQKMQMRANPVMQGRPAVQSQGVKPAVMPRVAGPRTSGSPMGGSYNQLVGVNPQLSDMRNTGMKTGQDMGWMDKSGALTMPNPAETSPLGKALQSQGGLMDVATRMNQPPPVQNPLTPQMNEGPVQMNEELGSRDPREILRMKLLGVQDGQVGRPDVMPRGLSPSPQLLNSPVIMDENGLEPRRGPR